MGLLLVKLQSLGVLKGVRFKKNNVFKIPFLYSFSVVACNSRTGAIKASVENEQTASLLLEVSDLDISICLDALSRSWTYW